MFIYWDGAGPGSRLWDLAYTASTFVPMCAVADPALDSIVPTIPQALFASGDHAQTAEELGGLASRPSIHHGVAHDHREEAEEEIEDESNGTQYGGLSRCLAPTETSGSGAGGG